VFIHAGTVSVRSKYDLANGALSAGDVLQMVKIPHGAIIDDLEVRMTTATNDTLAVVTVGDSALATRFWGSASLSWSIGLTISMDDDQMGYQYNLSDDAAQQYEIISITVGTVTSATATGTITMMCTYHCDEADPA